MYRKSYDRYWKKPDVLPINEIQRKEIARLKAEFVSWVENMEFTKDSHINIDPLTFELKAGEGDNHGKRLYKWSYWEFYYVRKWVVGYLNLAGFSESYHFYLRPPIGVIEFRKK